MRIGTDAINKTSRDLTRIQYAMEHDLDVMYAEPNHTGFATWTYSDGLRVPLKSFATLEGLQGWAARAAIARAEGRDAP